MSRCPHPRAIVIHSFKSLGLSYLPCTGGCCQPYWWMLTEGIISHQISSKKATKILIDAGSTHWELP